MCLLSQQAGIKFPSAVMLLPPAGQERSVYFNGNVVKMTNSTTILSGGGCNCIKLFLGSYGQVLISKVLKPESFCG